MSHPSCKLARIGCLFGAQLVFLLGTALAGQESKGKGAGPKKPAAGAVEVKLADESTLKVLLRDERIELETAYGKLSIPVADIQRIDVGLRLSDELRKKIEGRIVDLGNGDFRIREAASAELAALREKAYPALLKAAKGSDAEKTRRIEEILDKIRDAVPAEILETPLHDIVHTADSKIAGRIKADILRVGTLAFGDQEMRLTDIRSVRSGNLREPEGPADTNVLEPGALMLVANQVGKTFTFRVTGPAAAFAAQMGVFGTDVYTMDSSLASSAVHAGAVQPGKTALVRVTILGPQAGFQGSLRNGVASQPYGPWPGFRIEVPKGGGKKQ